MNDHLQLPLTDADGELRPALSRALFRARRSLMTLFALVTVFFLWQTSQLQPDASFEKMIPVSHPYIANYLESRADLAGLGNVVRIIVETREGDIFTAEYQELLKQITDEVFYLNGVDRSALQSLWTPNVRWQEVTEEGFVGGTVIPDGYDGGARALEQLRENTLKSGQIGRIVANDFQSAIIVAPLVERDPTTGERLDYHQLSADLERLVRDKYQSENISIHITGFAKLVGDLIDGATLVGLFFLIAFTITGLTLFAYSHCWRLTFASLLCSTVAVIWQLGLLRLMGKGLDPYSMLVPFLVFAVGISHSVQITNHFAHTTFSGLARREAARLTFIRLSKPGFIALLSDGVGFLTLYVIDIPVIQELALVASTGIAVLILTNLVLLPLVLSATGISRRCLAHRVVKDQSHFRHWQWLSRAATAGPARSILVVGLVLLGVGLYFGQFQKIGDLDPGAPELRPDSRYNQDNAYLAAHYSTSTDVFVVMAHTEPQQCGNYPFISSVNFFEGYMSTVPGVQSALSLVDVSKLVIMGMNEGNPLWFDVSRNQYILNNSLARAPSNLRNTDCSMAPVILFLDDHRADTLDGVVNAVESFSAEYPTEAVDLRMAAGNAGVEAATNIVIAQAQDRMLLWVYGVVIALCLLNFRSLRITACIIIPLALTSILGQALMAGLGIGVKVATLPVIALGVGIGVDYGIYIYSALQQKLADGYGLQEAYFEALKSTGTAVAYTGLTLAVGVGTWIYSPIKFQADMGLMLTFMFFWNMLGALVLLPALAWLMQSRKSAVPQN
ncbi:RND family transporter [Mangrovimicrobium sediminis]|uniref:RND family transporter n=1 Tax=Mangrovimicrobium sediminis TaxID=2562682 RepID=A0A4Z0M9L5_9GAMM|nr:MMPL family transporter [Haliea sp. SAOS-164]TGD76067.1 RND family transporter [Haliea sp. SAOS-164]